MKTLIVIGHPALNGVQYHHGDEIPPDALKGELLDFWADHGLVKEEDTESRRSVYRLFHAFSECSQSEQFTAMELAVFGLDK